MSSDPASINQDLSQEVLYAWGRNSLVKVLVLVSNFLGIKLDNDFVLNSKGLGSD